MEKFQQLEEFSVFEYRIQNIVNEEEEEYKIQVWR